MPPTLEELEAAHAAAWQAWQAEMTPETERALIRAADALRWARQATYEAEGVTNATLREQQYADDDEAE